MLAFGVGARFDNQEVGFKKSEKSRWSNHFWSGEDEGEKVGTGAGTGVDVAGHFTFHDGDTKGGNMLQRPWVKRVGGSGVDFQPTEGWSRQESGNGLAPFWNCGYHDLS